MSTTTIDTAIAKRLVQTSAILGASIIGQPGGWSVVLRLGDQERPLGAQRSDKPRTWRSLDRCVDYLKKELLIVRFDLLDATNFSQSATGKRPREDASLRLRNAHQSAAHDKWFREQVAVGVAQADSADAEWLTQDQADATWTLKRAEFMRLAKPDEGGGD